MTKKALLLGAVASLALAPAALAERGSDGHVNIIYWCARHGHWIGGESPLRGELVATVSRRQLHVA